MITKRLVPVERVHVEVATVHGERRVTEDLRRERIDVAADPTDG